MPQQRSDALRLEALVLAAGRASRFGGAKLLAPWRGGVLLDGALAAAHAAPVGRLLLVTGANGVAVTAAARAWARRAGAQDRLQIVEASDWAQGLSASLRAGLAALSPDVDGAFVFLGDMPRAPKALPQALAAALADGASAAAPVHRGELGNPVLLGATLFPDVARLVGDRGARGLLERLGPMLARVETPDAGVLFDVDTPQALDRA